MVRCAHCSPKSVPFSFSVKSQIANKNGRGSIEFFCEEADSDDDVLSEEEEEEEREAMEETFRQSINCDMLLDLDLRPDHYDVNDGFIAPETDPSIYSSCDEEDEGSSDESSLEEDEEEEHKEQKKRRILVMDDADDIAMNNDFPCISFRINSASPQSGLGRRSVLRKKCRL
jgi:hypothetical protein